jgi:hypothetical protein
MKPDEFLPSLAKQQEKLAKLKLEYEVRLTALKEKYSSTTNYKKNVDRNSNVDFKLEQLNKEKDKTVSYYEDTLKNAERKFEEVRDYCRKQIELINDKYDIKVAALESKKDKQDGFDEENDLILNKKKLEISAQEDTVADYKVTYERLIIESENRAKQEAKEQDYFLRQQQRIEETRQRQIAEQAAREEYDRKCDKEQEQEEQKYERYILLLSNHKKQLDKQLPAKLFNRYLSLNQDDRVLLLDKSLDSVIEYLSANINQK